MPGRFPCISWAELGAKLWQVLGRTQSMPLSQEEWLGLASACSQDRHGVACYLPTVDVMNVHNTSGLK